MIKLEKKDSPQVLVDNEALWTENIRKKMALGELISDAEKSRYRHASIKVALLVETSGKCAYCESKFLHIAYGDVEHIEPKSKAIENLFKWSNLTLACDRCNTNKSDVEGILDPYVEDPAEAFEFFGPMVIPYPANDKALLTERILKLNRDELRERRAEKIKYLADQLIILHKAVNPALRSVLEKDLIDNEMASSQEFAATARSFLGVMLPKILKSQAVRV